MMKRQRLKPVIDNHVVRPVIEFMRAEAAGGIALVLAALIALAWANSRWDGLYADLWSTELSLDLGFIEFRDDLRHWVNDGLMTLFFFVVGLEIKRELVLGELREPRRALLPAAAALGGMAVPAAIYLALNLGWEGERGWGIPMATDIAFATGVLSLAASRVALSVRVFLLALAIVDDIGAVMVIAVFYSRDLVLEAGVLALGLVAVVLLMQRRSIRAIPAYGIVGVILWAAVFKSGVHATVAGVTLGLLTPTAPMMSRFSFDKQARALVRRFREADAEPDEAVGQDERRAVLYSLERLSKEAESPLERLEHFLHPWVSFAIVPVFALANAGVRLDGAALAAAAESRVALGVALGLLAGKPVGILLFAWLATSLGLAALPSGVRWRHLIGPAILAGIGFTVALFITDLAFVSADLVEEAKIGILGVSLVAGGLGYLVVRAVRSDAPSA